MEDGRVALVFIDFPIPSHGYPSFLSHEAAHCASEQGRYWDMHDALFERQSQLAALDVEDEASALTAVVDIGTDLGLDRDSLHDCVASKRYRSIVASLFQQARERGVNSSPTLLLSSENHTEWIPGFVPFEELQPVIEREIARALGTPVATDSAVATNAPVTVTPFAAGIPAP